MSEITEMPDEVEGQIPSEDEVWIDPSAEHMKIAGLLGAVASLEVGGFIPRAVTSLPDQLSSVLLVATNSSAHPILGYTGMWLAERLSQGGDQRLRVKIGLLAATVVNFAGEAAQSLLLPSSGDFRNFLAPRHLPETFKDFVFALGGAALFHLYDKRIQKKQAMMTGEPVEAID